MSENPLPSSSDNPGGNGDVKAATSVDTLLGRVVVEQGLATSEEVHLCLEQQQQPVHHEDVSDRSLAALLLQNQFVTNRQLDRVRREVEAQKSAHPIPGYSLKKKLGAGAMATVYLARQISLDRLVAIKVLPRKYSSNAQFIERFYREGKAAAKLNHPHIVQAYDVGQAGDVHYFVMEYVDGRTVHDDILDRGTCSEDDAIDLVLQIAEALEHAHAKGFVHRDVKPKNIMMTKEGVGKLADMGLARALSDRDAAEAEAGRAFGTPYYISPEQIRGEVKIGPQADIYSLGATFYHMVTGKVPFEGENPSAVMHRHLKSELVPPDHVNPQLSAGVSEVIEMMMQKSRRHRYQNCADLRADIEAVKRGEPPTMAHKALDLSGLTSGTNVAYSAMEETREAPAILGVGSNGLFDHPAFLMLLVLLFISVIGNIILGIASFAG